MNQTKESLEILRTKVWNVDPRFARSVRPMIESYLNREQVSEAGTEYTAHDSGWFALKSKGFRNGGLQQTASKEDLIVTDDPKWDMTQHWWEEEGPLISPEDEFINVIDMTSSVTRNGGWCSAGSIEHRDQMIFASRFPNCIGHLFLIDTPGGSAFSKNDYQQGIQAARAAGQPVICWIDGMCCSAGVAAACQTDEIYVMHENDEVGCIGTMAAFYTLADGSADEDGYVYHELYDPESFEKNLEFRELANNNNADPMLADLAEDGMAFRQLVKENRPAVTEEMLHGKVFKARELMGILVDGVKTYEEVIDRFVELRGGAQLISHVVLTANEPAPEIPESPEEPEFEPDDKCGDDKDNKCGDDKDDKCGDDDKDDKCGDDKDDKCGDDDKDDKCGDDDKDDKCDDDKESATIPSISQDNSIVAPTTTGQPKSQTTNNMKQYSHINAALDVEAIAVTEDGSFYCNGALAETLEAHLAQAEQNASLLAANNETVNILNEKVKSLNDEVSALKEQVSALHSEKQALEAEVAEKNNQIVSLETEKENLNKSIEENSVSNEEKMTEMSKQSESEKEVLNATIAEKDQKIAELEQTLATKNEEVEELSKQTSAAPAPAPAAPSTVEKRSVHIYKEDMTSEERRKAFEAEMNRLRNA